METLRSRVLVLALFAAASAAAAGPLDPPPGPIAPSYKTLDQVQPRRAVQSLAGDAQSVYVIDQPGSYYLTGPITGASGKSAIRITATDVTLDLGGFTVTGVGGATFGIHITGGNVEVANGTVTGFSNTCVEAGTAVSARLRNLRARNSAKSGISAGWVATVEGCEADHNTEYGIFTNDNAVVDRCKSVENGLDGFRTGHNAVLSGCLSSHNGQDGFELGGFLTVTGCVASTNGGVGMRVGSSVTITGCSASLNDQGGVLGGSSLAVTGCTLSYNELFGLKATGGGSRIGGCTATGNTGDGISVFNTSAVVDCVCEGNSAGANPAAGIRLVGEGNRADSNVLNSNTVGIDADSGNNFIVRNSFSFNPARIEAAPGNAVAQIIVVPGMDFASTDPWANFGH